MFKCPSIARLISTGQITPFTWQSNERKGSHNASNGADESNREGELGDTSGDSASLRKR